MTRTLGLHIDGRSASRRAVGAGLLLLVVTFARVTPAGDLRVSTTEYGPWASAIAALETAPTSEGTALHVVVQDTGGQRARCGAYTLTLDAVSAGAFSIGTCDPNTNATTVVLAHRSALFATGDVVPRPLPAGIYAEERRNGAAVGQAAVPAGSELSCSVAVRPYLVNLQEGTRVYLSPGRYTLRPLSTRVTASADPAGWTLRTAARASVTIDYDVLDTARSEVVLHDRATLTCQTGVPTSDNAVVASTSINSATVGTHDGSVDSLCAAAPDLIPGTMIQGTLVGGIDHFHAICAHGAEGPDQVYRLRLEVPSQVTLRLGVPDTQNTCMGSSCLDGKTVMYIRPDCGTEADELVCDSNRANTTSSATSELGYRLISTILPAGSYYVVVDSFGFGTSTRRELEEVNEDLTNSPPPSRPSSTAPCPRPPRRRPRTLPLPVATRVIFSRTRRYSARRAAVVTTSDRWQASARRAPTSSTSFAFPHLSV